MRYQTTADKGSSIPSWETLEEFARQGVQRLLQRVLEEEVSQMLERERGQRRSPVDPQPGYRNGYGKPRRLTLSNGTITVRRPRIRVWNSVS